MIDTQESRSVLVFHDAPDHAAAIAAALRQHDFVVEKFGGAAQDAIQKLQAVSPSVVVLSLPLPGIDPAEVCRAAIALGRPAVVVASIDEPDVTEVARLLNAGASDFVGQAQGPDELVTRIRVHLRARGRLPRRATSAATEWVKPLPEAATPADGIPLGGLRRPKGTPRARVLVFETHPDLGRALRAVLVMSGFAVTLRRRTDDLYFDLLTRERDAVVLDVQRAGPELAALCEGVRNSAFRGPVVVAARAVPESFRKRAIEAGATDVLTLPELRPYLERRFPRADAERTGKSAGGSAVLDLRAVEAVLTDSEFKLFQVFFQASDTDVCRPTLKACIGLANVTDTDPALEAHIRRMRMKLVVFGLDIGSARGVGYRLVRLGGRAHI